MAAQLKLLVCGDVQGKYDVIFSRVEKLLKKGNKFDMLLCVGDFFGDDEESNDNWNKFKSSKTPPLSTYVLGPNSMQHLPHFKEGEESGFELCDNITYLGKKGVLKTSSGLRIAYLSGCESPGSGPKQPHCFEADDVKGICASLDSSGSDYQGVDILITSVWPKDVTLHGNAPSNDNCKTCGSAMVSELCKDIRPRYHFAGLEGVHYERLPYRNHTVLAESARHVTRFIGLAPVGNATKQKYLYAFSIVPLTHMSSADLNQQPPDTTESPFKVLQTKTTPLNPNNGEVNQFRWNMDQSRNQENSRKRKSNNFHNQPKKQSRPQDWSCWFCLGGEKVEKHLVASVGDLCYVALAKGGLTWDHVLVLPIAHHPSSLDLPDDTLAEVKKFKQALTKAFAEDGRSCVFFERCYRTDHMQIQVVPIPKDTNCDTIKQEFFKLAERHTDRQGKPRPLDLTELPQRTDLKQILPSGCPFFHVELPDGTRLFHRIQKYFPLQFGREAMCSSPLLNMPDRIDWRACTSSRGEETDTAKRFRQFFEKFDFTAEDEDDV